MRNKYFTSNTAIAGKTKNKQHENVLQTITLIFLGLSWIGYFYSIYMGNNTNTSSYSIMITIFSILNADVLFTKEKAMSKALDNLAKCEGILFFAGAVITIIQLILK